MLWARGGGRSLYTIRCLYTSWEGGTANYKRYEKETEMNYVAMLEHSYKQTKAYQSDPWMERLEFLAFHVFEFVTYENIISSLMAEKCLEVCKAISDKTTYEYIKTKENNTWYLLMVNMPFFQYKLNWGGSIRGAWWDCGPEKFVVESCGLYEGYEQLLEIVFDEKQWTQFIEAMVEFTRRQYK